MILGRRKFWKSRGCGESSNVVGIIYSSLPPGDWNAKIWVGGDDRPSYAHGSDGPVIHICLNSQI